MDTAQDLNLDIPVQQIELDLDALRTQCLLVSVTVRGTGMFSRANTFLELGIADEDIRRQRYTSGSKYLYPKEIVNELHSIETGVRKALDDLSSDIESFRPWRVMKFTAIPKWRERYEHFKSRLEKLKKRCLDEYDDARSTLAAEFAEAASRSWLAVRAQKFRHATLDGVPFLKKEVYIDHVVKMALAKFPTPEQIQTELTIEYHAARVASVADIEAQYLEAERLRAERDLIGYKEQAEKDKIYNEQQHQLRLLQLEQYQREEAAQAMIHAEIERARESLKGIKSPLEDAIEGLRTRIATDCQKMLDTIQRSGSIHGKVAEQGAGLLELYNLLSIVDDHKLHAALQELRQHIGPVGGKASPARDTLQIQSSLEAIVSLAGEQVDIISAGAGRFGAVE